MRIIGLTGGIASGKSTVSRYLMDKGFKIVDADLIARRVVEAGSNGLEQLKLNFGNSIINSDGSLNRKELSKIVFNDKEQLNLLNNLLHPLIEEEILGEFDYYKKEEEKVIFFDCPLLFENSYQNMCDETWLVSISYETQLERLTLRDNIDNLQANKIITSQMPLSKKSELADIVIYNELGLEDLYSNIDRLLHDIEKNWF